MKSQVLVVAALSLIAACRDLESQKPAGSHPDARPTATNPPDAASTAVGGTIKALLASPPASSEVVEVKGVVVVGVVKSSSRVTLFVQDPGGGPSSGIQVYCPKNGCTQYADLGSVARGEILDVSAKYTVFMGEAELQFATVTRTGMTGTPAFAEVDPAELAAATDTSSSAFQKWIGVAVKLKGGAVVTDITADAFKTTCPNMKPGDYYTGFLAKAGTKDVNVGLSLYNVVGWCLANPCDIACTQPVTEGMAFTQVRGIVRALGGKASVDPYLPDDLVPGASEPAPDGGVVPPPDGKPAVTPDAPEADAPSVPADGPVTGGGTVASLTMNPAANGAPVALADVVVVGNELRTSGAQVYVQDRGGGSYSGILIYCNTNTCKPALAALQPGDVISVTGSFSIHASGGGNTLELVEPLIVTPGGTTATPVAVDVPAALLAAAPDSAAFAPYNGVYVRVNTAVAVTSEHVVEFDSGSCTDKKFANAFAVSAGETSGYVYAFFNDSLSLCVAGGCATCDRAAAVGQTFPFLRGVLQTQSFHPASGTAVAKVVLAPVEDIDAPAVDSVRALIATPPAPQGAVTLTHVVVVGHDAVLGKKTANLFVQDPGGGRYSGVQVYCDKTQTGAGSCVDDILPLIPGDVVDITGSYDVYQKLTPEVVVPTAIVKSGQTVTPIYAHPAVADVSAGAGSADGMSVSNHFAPYNQVLVKLVRPAPVEAVAVDDLYSTCGLGKDDWKGFSLLVDSATVYVGDLFGETGMGLCSVDQCDNVGCTGDLAVKSTDSFDYVEGIARFSKNSKVQVAPRTLEDIPRTAVVTP